MEFIVNSSIHKRPAKDTKSTMNFKVCLAILVAFIVVTFSAQTSGKFDKFITKILIKIHFSVLFEK